MDCSRRVALEESQLDVDAQIALRARLFDVTVRLGYSGRPHPCRICPPYQEDDREISVSVWLVASTHGVRVVPELRVHQHQVRRLFSYHRDSLILRRRNSRHLVSESGETPFEVFGDGDLVVHNQDFSFNHGVPAPPSESTRGIADLHWRPRPSYAFNLAGFETDIPSTPSRHTIPLGDTLN